MGLTTQQRIDLVNRGQEPYAHEFVSARLMRAMATGLAPLRLMPGDGAHPSDSKAHLQDIREINPEWGDLRHQDDVGIEYLFCTAFNSRAGCKKRRCPYLHLCNYCRCGPYRRQLTGCINLRGQCCLHRGHGGARPRQFMWNWLAEVGVEPTPARTCPGAYWGHQAPLSFGAQICGRREEESYLVPESEWGVPPAFGQCRRLPARYVAKQ